MYTYLDQNNILIVMLPNDLIVKQMSLRLLILNIFPIFLGMNIFILSFPLNHPSLLLIYRYSFLRVSAKFGVKV